MKRAETVAITAATGFSALQRAEIAEIVPVVERATLIDAVSVLFNEPKLLKCPVSPTAPPSRSAAVSVLFNEPKLLKCVWY